MPTTKKSTQSVQVQSSTTTPAARPAAATPTASPPPAAPVDPNAALEQYVLQTVASLDTVEVGLGDDPALTPAEKRHGAKLRKGGADIFAQIGNLATQQQVESTAVNASDMNAALGKAQALQPLLNRVTAFAKHIEDVIFLAQSEAVQTGLQLYALLQRRSAIDSELLTAMQPITSFFAYRHPLPKVPGTPTKPQKKATAKAVKTLKKNAPQMLQGGATAAPVAGGVQPTAGTAAPQGASGQGQAGATAPAANGPGVAPSGNTAAASTGVAPS
jgi:hypothetical protein